MVMYFPRYLIASTMTVFCRSNGISVKVYCLTKEMLKAKIKVDLFKQ